MASRATIRRLLLLAALLLTPMLAHAQGGQFTLVNTSAEPLPNCTPAASPVQLQPLIWDTTAQLMKTCTAPNVWSTISGGGGGAFYQTFQVNGTPLTQEPTANFVAGTNMTITPTTVGAVTTLTFTA